MTRVDLGRRLARVTLQFKTIRGITQPFSRSRSHAAKTPNMNQTLLLAGAVTLIVLWLTLKFLAKRKVQNLHTKYVFITGCDSGFGRETAVRLDKMGIHVLASCLTKQGAQDLKSMTSSKLKTFQMDVTDSQQIKDVFRQVKNLLPSGQGKEKIILGGKIKITGVILTITRIILVVNPAKRKQNVRSSTVMFFFVIPDQFMS